MSVELHLLLRFIPSSLRGSAVDEAILTIHNHYIYRDMHKGGYVYIMSSFRRTVLYVGVTSNLPQRVWQHRTKHNPDSFTARYDCVICVYYKFYETIQAAIAEEKRIKGLRRSHKDALVESLNKDWKDLWVEIEGFF